MRGGLESAVVTQLTERSYDEGVAESKQKLGFLIYKASSTCLTAARGVLPTGLHFISVCVYTCACHMFACLGNSGKDIVPLGTEGVTGNYEPLDLGVGTTKLDSSRRTMSIPSH